MATPIRMRYIIRKRKPFRSMSRTQGKITINPIKAVNIIPDIISLGHCKHFEFL